MRCVYITARMPFGPGEAFIAPEIQELRAQGHAMLIVPVRPGRSVPHADAGSLREITVRVPLASPAIVVGALRAFLAQPIRTVSLFGFVAMHGRGWTRLKNLAVMPKALWLASVVRRTRPDHIHAHWAGTTSTVAFIVSRLSGSGWSFTCHRWDIYEDNLLRLKVLDAAFTRCISERAASEVARIAGVSSNLRVLHLGVRVPSTTAAPPLPTGTARILMPANFTPVKGHAVLLQAVADHCGHRIEVDLAGDGETIQRVRAIVTELGLGGRVEFLGRVPHERLMADLAAHRWAAVVLPSLDLEGGEGVPVSLMEAMARRVPVVSTTAGGTPELVHADAGWLVPPGDPRALGAAIDLAVFDQEARLQASERALAIILEHFDACRTAATLAAWMEEATLRGSGTTR